MSQSFPSVPKPLYPTSSTSTTLTSNSTLTPRPTTNRTISISSISSTSSAHFGEMKRSWQPSEAVPVITLDERPGVRRGVSASGGKGVEKDLTDLFVENAKNMDENERPAKRVKRGWGWGGMVNTAYSVSVFGAALGLTAYRVISGATGGESSHGREEIRERDEEIPPPPPPYEETVGRGKLSVGQGRGKVGVGEELTDGWEELDDETDIVTPTHSRSSTQYSHHQSSHSRQRSAHHPFTHPYSPSRPHSSSKSHHRKGSSISHISRSRTPRTSIYQQPTATIVDDVYAQPILPLPIPSPGLSELEGGFGGGAEEDTEGVVERLDAMSERLRELILEGQKALGEMPALSGEEWVDEDVAIERGG